MDQTPEILFDQGVRPFRVVAYPMNLDAVKVLVSIPQAIGQDAGTPTMRLLSGFITPIVGMTQRIEP